MTVNQYGQTDLTAALLRQGMQPNPYKTALGQGLRLGAVALAQYGDRKRQENQRNELASALRGILPQETSTQGGAGIGDIATTPNPRADQIATMLSNPATSQIATALLGRELNPPQRQTEKDAGGYLRYLDTGDRVFPDAQAPGPKPTSSMLEYQLAQRQGFEGSFADFQRYMGQTTPSGFRETDNGLAPIPGGPADPAYIAQTAPLKRPQTTVNVGKGETEFEKATGKDLAAARTAIVDAGQRAVGTEQTFRQLGDLLEGGVRTGSLQPTVAALQGIAEDMGVDLSATAQGLGIELGDLSNQQNFQRLATQVVIDGFEQFKGNLNTREVQLAEGAFGGLGTTPEANADAIAAGIAASQIARQRAVQASRAQTQADVRALQESLISGDVTEFERMKDAIKRDLLAKRGADLPTISGDADYDALPPGTQFRAPDGSIRVKQ
ncbi:MAG: hypothetical protein ACMVY4_12305 [Minwuia sp.]|uniref:hypothetical protein n=1 Tax=Minwuia sp. TaxID=2493630 RepID=UPI003A855E87